MGLRAGDVEADPALWAVVLICRPHGFGCARWPRVEQVRESWRDCGAAGRCTPRSTRSCADGAPGPVGRGRVGGPSGDRGGRDVAPAHHFAGPAGGGQLLALLAAVDVDPRLGRCSATWTTPPGRDSDTGCGGSHLGLAAGNRPAPAGGLVRWQIAAPVDRADPWQPTTPWLADSDIVAYLCGDARWAAFCPAGARRPDRGGRVPVPGAARARSPVRRPRCATVAGCRGRAGGPARVGPADAVAQLCARLGRDARRDRRAVARGAGTADGQAARRGADRGSPRRPRRVAEPGALTLVARRRRPLRAPAGAVRLAWTMPELPRASRLRLWQELAHAPPPAPVEEWTLTPAEVASAAAAVPAGPRAVCARHPPPAGLGLEQADDGGALPLRVGRPRHGRGRPRRAEGARDADAPRRRGARRLGLSPAHADEPRHDGAVRRPERDRQDDGGAGARPLARPRPLPGRPRRGRQQVHRRDREAAGRRSSTSASAATCWCSSTRRTRCSASARRVSDAHDRYANIEIDYLLQRMDTFDGVAILATNRKGDLDSAFLRRIRVVVDFLAPDPAERLRLWQLALPRARRRRATAIDREWLAEPLTLTGARDQVRRARRGLPGASAGERSRPEHVLDGGRGASWPSAAPSCARTSTRNGSRGRRPDQPADPDAGGRRPGPPRCASIELSLRPARCLAQLAAPARQLVVAVGGPPLPCGSRERSRSACRAGRRGAPATLGRPVIAIEAVLAEAWRGAG